MTALSAALALSACSGDGAKDEAEESGEKSSAASESESMIPLTGCKVRVDATGAAEIAWKSDGYRGESGDGTLYYASNGRGGWISVNLGADDSAELMLTVADQDYPANPKTVKATSNDAGADVSATVPLREGMARVKASFTCVDPGAS